MMRTVPPGVHPHDTCESCGHSRQLHHDGTCVCVGPDCECRRFVRGCVWRRTIAKAGPADVLNDRWHVRRGPHSRWYVADLRSGEPVTRLSWSTMRDARDFAERHAVEHDQLLMARAARLFDEAQNRTT